jgi:hypothetical protein
MEANGAIHGTIRKTTTVVERLKNKLMSIIEKESKIRPLQRNRSFRSAHYSPIYLPLLILLLAEPTAQAGIFTDGDVTVQVGGSIYASGVWGSGSGGVSFN